MSGEGQMSVRGTSHRADRGACGDDTVEVGLRRRRRHAIVRARRASGCRRGLVEITVLLGPRRRRSMSALPLRVSLMASDLGRVESTGENLHTHTAVSPGADNATTRRETLTYLLFVYYSK